MHLEIKELAEITVACVRHIGLYSESKPAWKTLCAWGIANGVLDDKTKFIGICYDDLKTTPAENIRYDACISVPEGTQGDTKVGIQTLNGKWAIYRHVGPYEMLHATYEHFRKSLLSQSNLEITTGPCLEIYQTDPDITPPAELVTDIYIPLK